MAGSGSSGLAVGIGLLAAAGVFGLLAYFALHTPLPAPKARVGDSGSASPEVDIDVYVDGSKSMKQFLRAGTGPQNYLWSMLEDLGTRMNSAHGNHSSGAGEWTDATVNYWKFGAFRRGEIDAGSQHPFAVHLEERDLRSMAEDPERWFDATRTPIEKPIVDRQGGTHRSKLKVIVTDLYQSGSDTGTYANPLANEYLDDDLKAVAVLAVRNPFAGVVDDLPGCGSLRNAADTMPFYVIVAGPVGDVRHAVAVLRGTAGLSESIKDDRWQEWFFSKAPSLIAANEQQPTVRIVDRKSPGREWRNLGEFKKSDYPRVQASVESGVTDLTIRKGEPAEVSWGTPVGVEGAGLETGFESKVTVSRSKDRSGNGVEDAGAEDAVEKGCTSHKGRSGGLCVTIDEGRLKTPANYLVEVDLMARPVLGSEPPASLKADSELMRRWDIERKNSQEVCTQGSFPRRVGVAGQQPGMTPQLRQFLIELYDKRLNAPVRTASYSLYVKAR